MTDWRALTLRQPWAWAVAYADKRVENRTWPVPPKYLNRVWKRECATCGGPTVKPGQITRTCSDCEYWPNAMRVMIHAGAAWDKQIDRWNHSFPDGSTVRIDTDGKTGEPIVVGSPNIGMQWTADQSFSAVVAVATITHCTEEDYLTDPSPWAQFSAPDGKQTWHWHLDDVTVLETPVPAKGWSKLWTPDQAVVDAVEAQL